MDERSTTAAPSRAEEEAATAGRGEEVARLRERAEDLQRERDHLVAIVDILQEISGSVHFADILQAVARKLGDAFGLDRCTIFLTGENDEVRLVASYEDPTVRNLVVDVNRYPELKRAFESGETVVIVDATNEPALRGIKETLATRNVRSIIVTPIQWKGRVIGAIFIRTQRNAPPLSEADVRFCQIVAALTAKALRNAHRFDVLLRDRKEVARAQQRGELQRIAMLAFMRRLLERSAQTDDHLWADALLPKTFGEEIERLVSVAMQVIDEEAGVRGERP